MMVLLLFRFIAFSAILYFSYRLFFSRMSFFRLNRRIILGIPALSMLIPLIAPHFNAPAIARPTLNVLLHEVNIGSSETHLQPIGINWPWMIYFAGVSLFLISFAVGLLKAWHILQKARPLFENVHISEEAIGPFAFFREIVIPSTLLKNKNLQSIIAHEKAHVEQYHTYDVLFYNVLCAIFWFNPFIHLLSRELRQVHECLADEAALTNTSRQSYAQLILSSAFGSEISFDATNRFFNSSLIKTRITMMYKTKTNRKMRGLYLAFLPLLMLLIIVSCQKTPTQPASHRTPLQKKSDIISFSEADQPPLFEQCDANASREEQMECFQHGIMHYVMENFKYPERAKQTKLEGKIYVKFIIEPDGKINNIEIVKSDFGKSADLEAVEETLDYVGNFIKSIPNLSPAIKDGKKVAVTFILPINMKLD